MQDGVSEKQAKLLEEMAVTEGSYVEDLETLKEVKLQLYIELQTIVVKVVWIILFTMSRTEAEVFGLVLIIRQRFVYLRAIIVMIDCDNYFVVTNSCCLSTIDTSTHGARPIIKCSNLLYFAIYLVWHFS